MAANKTIVFLCSGGGANMRFIHQAIAADWLENTSITAVITDRLCGASHYATRHGIAQHGLDFQADGHAELESLLDRINPDVVISNIHRILCPGIVQKFMGRIINLHYSLLPAFAGSIGTTPVKQAIAQGAKFTGVTVHTVTEAVDAGPPLVQAAIPLHAGECFNDGLMDAVFRAGCLALLTALSPAPSPIATVTSIHGRECLFSSLHMKMVDEAFWRTLKQTGDV